MNPFSLDTKRSPVCLTLTELEATTSLGLTWLLTFNDTGIAGEEASLAECCLVLSIDLNESACDGETNGTSLAIETTALEVHLDIVLLSYTYLVEGLLYDELKD